MLSDGERPRSPAENGNYGIIRGMRPIATETNDFETLRAKGQIYVDKTSHLHRMITDPSRSFFFCARPRRFGKAIPRLPK